MLGGLALLAGLFTHWVAIPLAANMTVAAYTNAVKVHLPFAGNDNQQGYELDIVMVAALVALVLGGAGPLSLDQLPHRRLRRLVVTSMDVGDIRGSRMK